MPPRPQLTSPFVLCFTAVLAGCVAPAPVASVPGPDEVLPDPVAAPTSPLLDALVVTEPPGYCEQLLENLESARPILEGLDTTLAGHTQRMAALVDELKQPIPAANPVDCPELPNVDLGSKDVIGTIEWIYMNPPGAHYEARVDSGAETSSLSARDVTEFERDGDDWVRFSFEHEATDQSVAIEQPIVRTIVVRQPGMGEAERRVVIELDIRLGERLQRTEFALTDRSRMSYPVLLGRAFIRDLYVIDVARSYLHPQYEAP